MIMPSAAADFSPPPKERRNDENLQSIPSGSSRSSSSSSGSSSNHHCNGSSTSGQPSSSRSPGRKPTTTCTNSGSSSSSSSSGGGGGTGKRDVSMPLPFETNDADALKLRIYTAPLQVEMPVNLSLSKRSKLGGGKGKLNAFDVQLETYSYPTWERCKVQVASH